MISYIHSNFFLKIQPAKYVTLRISILGFFAVFVAVSLVYMHHKKIQHPTHRIEFTETGFVPKNMTIAKEDSITFTTARGVSFWPASDLHPTHELYSEFDPKRPIPTNESWSFKFDRVGEWEYHDHLNPLFRGMIVVRNESEGANVSRHVATMTIEECDSQSENTQRLLCWQDAVDAALSSKGVDAAFDIVARLSAEYPEFAGQCHGFTHLIGEAAYQLFRDGKKIEISQQASYCGYGFYHGFLEALLQKGGTMEQARKLCEDADKEYSRRVAQSAGPLRACYHGIGHGVTDGSDSRTWGDVSAMIGPGLAICERFGSTDFKKELCASGVFNSLAIMYPNARYHLPFKKNDPYGICRLQGKSYVKKSCYEEMNTLVLGLMGNNFNKAANIADKISERIYAQYAIQSIASYAASSALQKSTHKNFITSCRALAADMRNECIDGFVGGLFEFGSPGREYQGVLDFCSSGLTASEKRVCYQSVVGYGSYMYTQERMDEVCVAIEHEYQYVCRK